ncbi:hypothetical protein [Salipaludibacillus aurantiacus]|uniref:Uncharacterized protein n=1 Tax=Salipaludibacillus aurantiacus TaxID=1601833 RepID=A0A1H9UNK4_9BACI|nr:hypothetical protein [Salipaludibacillus aurantiacus]SES10888.1 hypothetical protein SAMN05518684_10861 [Salipaludibacillus aurantiacus]
MTVSQPKPNTDDLLLQAFNDMEESIVDFFRISEKLIQGSQLSGIEKDGEYENQLGKLIFCFNSFFSQLIEIEKMVFKKRAVILHRNAGEADSRGYHNKYIHNRKVLKTHIERITDILSNCVFYKETRLIRHQLKEFSQYCQTADRLFEDIEDDVSAESFPEPAPPLIKIMTGKRTGSKR